MATTRATRESKVRALDPRLRRNREDLSRSAQTMSSGRLCAPFSDCRTGLRCAHIAAICRFRRRYRARGLVEKRTKAISLLFLH
jgi:hypothetical protein